jgi:predicted aspartyl protease
MMGTVRLALVNDPIDPEAIDVWVDGFVGDAPVKFRLDSGAARCTVPLLDRTKMLTITGVDSAVGLSGTGLGDDEVVVPRLRLGDLVIDDVAATRLRAGSPLSPLLGMTALGRFLCDFRFSLAAWRRSTSEGSRSTPALARS